MRATIHRDLVSRPPDARSMTLPSPWGPVRLTTSGDGVWAVDLRPDRSPDGPGPARPGAADQALRDAARLLEGALAGEPVDLAMTPLDWTGIGSWDQRVLAGARTLERGEVTSYGRLAKRIGAPGAARAVGAALGRNPFWLFVPCHRVVAGDGSLGGYGDEPDALEIKRDLLALEGIALPVADLVD